MTEFELTLSTLTMRGVRYGDENKPALIALHGWLDNAASFRPLSEHLTDYQLISLDFAGHGKSDHRANGAHYHLIDNIQDLHEAIALLALPEVNIVAHSMVGNNVNLRQCQ